MAKGCNVYMKPGDMAKKVNEFEKQKKRKTEMKKMGVSVAGAEAGNEYENLRNKRVEMNMMRMSAAGFTKMADSFFGSKKKGNGEMTKERNNMLDLDDDDVTDDDVAYEPHDDGEANFSSSSDKDEEAPPKRSKIVSAPASTTCTRAMTSMESTVIPTPTQELPLQPQSLSAAPASTLKRVRGVTRGISTERLITAKNGTKLVVEVPLEVGAPVGENATRFATWLGTQIRLAAPLKDIQKWDDIPPAIKAPIIQATRDKFEILDYDEKEHVVRGINRKCQKLYRTWRHDMKQHYLELVEGGTNPYSKPYKGVNCEEWAWMIDNIWTNTDKEEIVKKRKAARAEVPWDHCMGSRSFAVAMSIQAKERGGQRPSLDDFYKSSHYNQKKKKWANPLCEKVHEQLGLRRQEVEATGTTNTMPQEEMVVEADGKMWYTNEYGVRSKPLKRCRASSIQDMLVLRNEVVAWKEAYQTKTNEVDTLKEKLSEYDEKFEKSSKLMEEQAKLIEEQAKKIEHLDAIVCAFMQGARTGANSFR